MKAVSRSSLRLFTALDMPPEICDHLGEVIARLQTGMPRGSVKWVRPNGIHLTLKFFGSIPSARVESIQAALTQAAAMVSPFALRVEGLGVFPSPLRPRVIWVGLEGELSALEALQGAVEMSVGALGFKPETRHFKPHLTLGRVNDHVAHADRPRLGRALEALSQEGNTSYGEFTARHMALIRSELRPTGAVYTPLFSAPLAGQ